MQHTQLAWDVYLSLIATGKACYSNCTCKNMVQIQKLGAVGLQASIGQLQEAHMLFGDYIAAFSHFGWIPEQVSVMLNQVRIP